MTIYRIAHLSDVHLDTNASHLGSQKFINGENVYYTERLNRFRKSINNALKQGIDAIVLSGDIHNRSRPVAKEYEDLASTLADIPTSIPVLVPMYWPCLLC